MLKNMLLGIRRVWIGATLSMLLFSVMLLCRAEPEAKNSGLALLLGNLALGWLFFQDKALRWLTQNWKLRAQWPKRTLLETLQAVGGLSFMTALVGLGAFILFAETCLPPYPFFSK
ncbi:MAG: hypothetical protein ACKVP0_18505 [Pirellulaceae bacterium]